MIKITKEQALKYKQRWKRVAKIQTLELQNGSISLRFQQLCLLMNSFHFMFKDRENQKEIGKIRRRWLVLKEQWENGH